MVKDNFVGVWRLVVSEAQIAGGPTLQPYGKDPVGVLAYHERGYMSVQIMKRDLPHFVSGDIRNGTPEEIKVAFEGYTAYFGNYEISEQESIVIHHIQGSHFPNWVGQAQKRFFEFSGNRLILRTPPIPTSGTTATLVLVWERDA